MQAVVRSRKRRVKKVAFRTLEEFVEALRERGIKRVRILTKRTYNPRGTREIIRLLSVARTDGEEIMYVATRLEASTIRASFVSREIEKELHRTRDLLVERFLEEGFEIVEGVKV